MNEKHEWINEWTKKRPNEWTSYEVLDDDSQISNNIDSNDTNWAVFASYAPVVTSH